jgi:hypothetical protein
MNDERTRRIRFRWIYLPIIALCLSIGCGYSPTTYPVSGKVVAAKGGKPISGGMITFQLDKDPTLTATGEIQKDGSFTLTTYYVSSNYGASKPGAPTGEYSVTVEPAYGDELPNSIVGNSVSKKFTVKEGENSFVIELEK